MAGKVNLKKVRKRYDRVVADKETGGGGQQYWKPPQGKSRIRILPPWADDEDLFYREAKYHFSVGPNTRTVYCLAQKPEEEDCYICKVVDKLGKSSDKDKKNLSRRMRAKRRFYYNIIDRGDESVGVQIFASGIQIFKDIAEIFSDSDYGDITDPREGYDLVVIRQGEKMETEYHVRPAKSASKLGKKRWLTQLHDLDALVKVQDYAEQRAIFEGSDTVAGEDDEGDEDEDTENETPKSKKKKKKKVEEEDDEDEEEEEDEDDEDEDEDEEDEEDEKPKGKKKKKKKKKVADEDEDEDEEEEEDEDEDEEEEEDIERALRKAAKRVK